VLLLLPNPEVEGDFVPLIDPEGLRVPRVLSVEAGEDESVTLVEALTLCVLVGRADTLVEPVTDCMRDDDTLAELVLHPLADDVLLVD
jgi:hypothetical protein